MTDTQQQTQPSWTAWRKPRARGGMYLLAIVLVGALGGLAWVNIVRLPTFTITDDFRAVPVPENELGAWFATDAWFSIIGIAVGLALGLLSWWWFNRTGWLVIVFATGGALLAAAVCLSVGWWLGPSPFEMRLAAAQPGDVVSAAFELRSWAAFLLWALAAITPVMLLSTFTSDADQDVPASVPTMTE